MHLRDYLNDIPLKALKTIADTLGIDVEYRARIKLMNAIDRAFWDTGLTRRLVDGLSDDHRKILAIVAFSYSAGVPESILVRKMEKLAGLKRSRTFELIHDLIPLALVGGIRDEKNIFFCPDGIAAQVRSEFLGEAVSKPESPGQAPTYSPPNLLEDIYSFLATLYKENIPLTLMGKIRKTALDRIFNGSPTCGSQEVPFSEDHRNTFIIDYCRDRALVEFNRGEVVISPRLKGWLALSNTERVRDIVAFAMMNKIQDSLTIITVHNLFAELEKGCSLDANGLARFLDTRTAAPGGLKRIEARIRDFLNILYQIGLLSYMDGRYYLIETGERLFRGGHLPLDEKPGSHFTIQPNFEVIIGPEFEPRLRFMLELLADRKNRDTVLTYTVSQKGITRARERDLSTDEILRFFHEHSRNPLPQNVLFSIESWSNSYGTVFFETVTLMRCRTSEICDSIVHTPSIEPYIMEQLSDNTLVVSSNHVQAISGQLRKAGFLPEAFGETEPDSVMNGTEFNPSAVSSLISDNAMPDIHHDFIFPDHLLSEREES